MKPPTPRRLSHVLALTGSLLAFPAWAQEIGKDWLLEPMEWSSPTPGLERVTVTNRFGAVRIGGTSGELAGLAELHAMVQRHADDPRQPEVIKKIDGATLSIEVTYPGDADVPRPPDAWRKRRIDITVYVDRETQLTVETLHGKVVVKGHAGKVQAISESGDIEIKATGPIVATSKYGKIDTFFTGTALTTPLELETVTGAIHLSLPWRARPQARIETRGEITSDYSVDIEWLPDSTLKRGTVVAQGSSEAVVLRSNRGNIRLLRRIDDRSETLESTAEALERHP